MPYRLMASTTKACLASLLAAALQGCITSDKPLLSEDQNIVDKTIAGAYLVPKGYVVIRTLDRKYLIFGVKRGGSLSAGLQKLDDHFYLAQVKDAGPQFTFSYWLAYLGLSHKVRRNCRNAGYGILLTYPSRQHDPLSDVGDVLPWFSLLVLTAAWAIHFIDCRAKRD